MRYIPYDKTKAKDLEWELSRIEAYDSVDQFIYLYNSELISNNDKEINALAKRISETYINVDHRLRRLIVRSREEVTINTLELLLPHLRLVAELKRIATDLLQENHPDTTSLVFDVDNDGYVYYVDTADEEPEVYIYKGAERLPKLVERVSSNPMIHTLLQDYDRQGKQAHIPAITLASLDTSMLIDIEASLREFLE